MKLLTQWAFTSSALILIVLAVRVLFRNKLSARLRYALWGVVLLRLLVPFQVELPAAASDALPVLASNLAQDVSPRLDDTMLYAVPTERYPSERVQPGEEPEYSRTLHGGVGSDWDYYAGGVRFDENGTTRYAFMMPASELLLVLWKWGAALCLIFVFYSNWCFSMRLDRSRKQLEDVDAPIPVYVAEGLPSPCLFGVFRPAVYVTPQAVEGPAALRHVLAHELTHYAHRDHLWSLLRCLALALHWYNPLVWLAVVLSKQDGELACDEGAVARLGEAERIPYGRTLVDMVAARSLRPGDLLSCSTAMTGGESSIKRRVTQIVKKPETVKTAVFGAAAILVLGAVFVFAGRGAAEQESGMLADYLDRTTAIRYCPPIYSSQFYSESITGPDLLAEAKEALSGFRYLEDSDPQPDLSAKELMRESRVILTFEGGEMEYSLLWQNNRTYLFTGSIFQQGLDLQEDEGETAQLVGVSGTCISRPGDDVISTLESLARRQMARPASSGSPELDQFFSDLERAQSIFVGQPMISSANPPGLISAPAALSQARDLLRRARVVPVYQLEENVSLEDIRKSLSSTEEPLRLTQEYLENMLFLNGCSILLYPDPEPTPDAEYRYFLSRDRSGNASMLLQWDAELEEKPIKLLATFPGDVYSQLAELARNTARYEDFLDRVRGAVSIQIEEGTAKSSDELGPITNPEWLEQARTALLSLAPLPDNVGVLTSSSEEELRHEAGGGLYAITLTDKAGETVTCYIDRRPSINTDYLVFPMSEYPAADSRETVSFYRVGVLPGEAGYALHLAAKVSNGVLPPPTGYAKPDLTGAEGLASLLGDLTQEQVDRANEAFAEFVEISPGGYASSEISCFFTSSYDDPTQIDLEEFLRYCPIGTGDCLGEEDTEEFLAVMAQDNSWTDPEWELHSPYDLPVPVHRYPRAEVSALLQKYAGITVEELDWEGCLYLKKYDAFYNFTSDAGPGFFPCAGGQIMEDSVLLWSKPDENGDRCELVLRKDGNRWLIQSHHTIYER